MVFRGATSLLGALEGVGPENLDFFGPWNSTHPEKEVRGHSPNSYIHVSVSDLHIYFYDRSAYSQYAAARKKVDRSWEYIDT